METYEPSNDINELKEYIDLQLNILAEIAKNNTHDYKSFNYRNTQERILYLNKLKKSLDNIDLYLSSHKIISNATEAYRAFYEYKRN